MTSPHRFALTLGNYTATVFVDGEPAPVYASKTSGHHMTGYIESKLGADVWIGMEVSINNEAEPLGAKVFVDGAERQFNEFSGMGPKQYAWADYPDKHDAVKKSMTFGPAYYSTFNSFDEARHAFNNRKLEGTLKIEFFHTKSVRSDEHHIREKGSSANDKSSIDKMEKESCHWNVLSTGDLLCSLEFCYLPKELLIKEGHCTPSDFPDFTEDDVSASNNELNTPMRPQRIKKLEYGINELIHKFTLLESEQARTSGATIRVPPPLYP
ncbi:hypothetical protein MNV49_006290 [Pseudohyphozyma bogoriensis]|nr:hypothetical protein MNV49_006290 [Pseudohyphozyma bogoriensis]